MGPVQVAPPSVVFIIPMPVPSKASPRPRYSVLVLAGSMASAPTDSEPRFSVNGAQVEPPLVVFHTPPPENAA